MLVFKAIIGREPTRTIYAHDGDKTFMIGCYELLFSASIGVAIEQLVNSMS